MADETEADAQAKPEKSGGGIVGKLVSGIGILVLVIAGNLASNLIVRDFLPDLAPAGVAASEGEDGGKGKNAKDDDAPPGPPIYLAMDPPLVASIDDGNSIRFLQITIEVMSRTQPTLDAVMAHTPKIRNDLLMLLGRKEITELTSPDGKEKLRQEALGVVQGILEQMGPAKEGDVVGEVEDLYFTSFVVQ